MFRNISSPEPGTNVIDKASTERHDVPIGCILCLLSLFEGPPQSIMNQIQENELDLTNTFLPCCSGHITPISSIERDAKNWMRIELATLAVPLTATPFATCPVLRS